MCGMADFAVKSFYRKDRKNLRKGRNELAKINYAITRKNIMQK